VVDTSILDFLLALYTPLGFTEQDFVYDPYAARDLMTGEATDGQGKPTTVDLEPLKEQAAKVQANETIYDAADRHLRRHGLMHWDSPDGKICIGYPNDSQAPIFNLRLKRGAAGRENNVKGVTRTIDYSGIPSVLALMGSGGKKGRARKRIGAMKSDREVINAGFKRKVVMPAEGIKQQSLADRAVAREMSARSKRKDAIEVELDGLSYWDGNKSVPWGIDCVVNCDIDTAGGALGPYYVHRVTLNRDPSNGDKANLTLLKTGIWVL
jgi:prophage tail gpP-like protein